ncbi:MAG: hypothetical protein NVS4B7_11460 [Ktedonobacteraceae bacterium]
MRGIVLIRRVIGVILLIAIGLIHLLIVRSGLHLQAYLGVLFIIDVVAAFAGAVWIGLFDAPTGWLLGGLAALGPLVGYMVTRTIGLPGLHVLPWNAPNGLLSLLLEAIMVLLALSTLARHSATKTASPV